MNEYTQKAIHFNDHDLISYQTPSLSLRQSLQINPNNDDTNLLDETSIILTPKIYDESVRSSCPELKMRQKLMETIEFQQSQIDLLVQKINQFELENNQLKQQLQEQQKLNENLVKRVVDYKVNMELIKSHLKAQDLTSSLKSQRFSLANQDDSLIDEIMQSFKSVIDSPINENILPLNASLVNKLLGAFWALYILQVRKDADNSLKVLEELRRCIIQYNPSTEFTKTLTDVLFELFSGYAKLTKVESLCL